MTGRLTVPQFAKIAGESRDDIMTLISTGQVSAEKSGPIWLIELASAARYLARRNP